MIDDGPIADPLPADPEPHVRRVPLSDEESALYRRLALSGGAKIVDLLQRMRDAEREIRAMIFEDEIDARLTLALGLEAEEVDPELRAARQSALERIGRAKAELYRRPGRGRPKDSGRLGREDFLEWLGDHLVRLRDYKLTQRLLARNMAMDRTTLLSYLRDHVPGGWSEVLAAHRGLGRRR